MDVCSRFQADGSRCGNRTNNSDGWCRQPGCAGFIHRSPNAHPSKGKEKSSSPGMPASELSLIPAEIVISAKAIKRFQDAHGGNRRSAEVQLANMVEDFARDAKAIRSRRAVILKREGFNLVLSEACDVVADYRSMHVDRTWEQVKAGIRSRVGVRRSDPLPEPGPPVALEDVPAASDADSISLTLRVRKSFAASSRPAKLTGDELDNAIRAGVKEALARGEVRRLENGVFEVRSGRFAWLVTPDCRILIGVRDSQKPVQASQ